VTDDFSTDDEWQRAKRDAVLVPHFYRRFFWMRYQFVSDLDVQKSGVDTLIFGSGDPVKVDEKIVRWPEKKNEPHTAFALETISCTVSGREKMGWMFYSEADRLLYCFDTPKFLDCWWLDFKCLCEWFWPREQNFPPFLMKHTINKTRGRVVDIGAVVRDVPAQNFQLPLSE
jgi:hypothetical protein